MRTTPLMLLGLLLCAAGISGCGSAGVDDDFQSGNRLVVVDVKPADGDVFTVNALRQTEDLGCDGEKGTGDEGEGNGLPDACEATSGAEQTTSLPATITLENQPRQGVDKGVDLIVTTVDVTYLDADNDPRFRVNRQFPTGTVQIKPESVGDVTIDLMPGSVVNMANGPADLFQTKNPVLTDPISQMTAVLDIYAEDQLNGRTVTAQQKVSINIKNPMQGQ